MRDPLGPKYLRKYKNPNIWRKKRKKRKKNSRKRLGMDTHSTRVQDLRGLYLKNGVDIGL